MLAALFAVCFKLTESNAEQSFLEWWRDSVLSVAGVGTEATEEASGSAARSVVQVAAALTSILFPALVLGAVVYKWFLLPDFFLFRRRVAVVRDEEDGEFLAFRLYNTTRLTAVDIDFEVYLRAPVDSPEGRRVPNRKLQLLQESWPVALPGVPYTLRARLAAGDADRLGEHPRLVSVGGIALPPKFRILVVLQGSVPELGAAINEIHWFKASDIDFDKPAEIEVDYDRRPKAWAGWDRFD